MSGEHAKKEMVTSEKPATSHGKAPSGESRNKKKEESPPHKSHRSGEKKKKMKKVVYYETDSSSPSTSGSDAPSVTFKRHERKKFSKIPLRYPRISKQTPLLFVPLGKPPAFNGEDSSRWSEMMKYHLTSLHTSIWDIVEFGAQVTSVGDEDYDADEVAQIQHLNSQATTILLTSLSREEYNKVQGLKSAKEIWDVLKTAHEGDEVTKITKSETIEGELGRFMLNQGEDLQAMYNRLKTLVNQVRNLRSTKWDDHEMVKVILRSLVFLNPTQVQLIRGDPRYKLMSPEEVIGKFVSFELMIKGSKKIIEQGASSSVLEAQPVAFKATEEKKEDSTPSRVPTTPPSSTMRRWRSSSRASAKSSSKERGKITSPVPRRFATNVVSPVILSLNVHCLVIVIGKTTRGERGRKRRSTTRRRVATHMFAGSGTPTRAPPTPPTTRTPSTSPSTKASSSPTSATSASWQRTARRRR
jgi:hypothetical protein